VPFFADPSRMFMDITVPGWAPTAENVAMMAGRVEGKSVELAAFVFNLFGNSSVRFEQFYGTTAL
jgi:hypothetical protein